MMKFTKRELVTLYAQSSRVIIKLREILKNIVNTYDTFKAMIDIVKNEEI